MNPDGDSWIKSYRKTRRRDSIIWRMPPLYHRVWIWLLWEANCAEGLVPVSGFGVVIVQRGQVFTSIGKIAEAVRWYERNRKKVPNKKTIYRILKWLESHDMILIEANCLTSDSHAPNGKRLKSNGPFTLITILNYNKYQGDTPVESNAESNGKVTAGGHKQERIRRKKNIYTQQAESIYQSYPKKADKQNSIKSITKLLKSGLEPHLLLQAIENYKTDIRLNGTERQYWIQSNNFFGRAARWEEWRDGGPPEPEDVECVPPPYRPFVGD